MHHKFTIGLSQFIHKILVGYHHRITKRYPHIKIGKAGFGDGKRKQ